MGKSNELGAWGEEKAAAFLKKQGLRILKRNYRCRYGELDIIAEDDDFLIFAEVRLRKSTRFGTPEETVDARKQQKLRLAAESYLQEHPTMKQPRFDVVALYAKDGMETSPLPVRYIKNAF